MNMHRTRLLLLFAGALLLCGCRSRPEGSGFLSDYSQLKKNKNHEHAWGWQNDAIDLRDYDRLIIDPVQVKLLPESQGHELSDETLRKVASAFRNILIEAVEPYYNVVSSGGPGVLRLKIAVTDVEPAPNLMDSHATGSVDVGQAAMEAEMIDSATGELVAAAMSRIKGSEEGYKAPERWRHVEGAFREWAQRLLDYLDERYAED
ncbi:MAG: DUF3313 domain-containing protein [Planctomycetota bacterium]|jgi:hypothetical protein